MYIETSLDHITIQIKSVSTFLDIEPKLFIIFVEFKHKVGIAKLGNELNDLRKVRRLERLIVEQEQRFLLNLLNLTCFIKVNFFKKIGDNFVFC